MSCASSINNISQMNFSATNLKRSLSLGRLSRRWRKDAKPQINCNGEIDVNTINECQNFNNKHLDKTKLEKKYYHLYGHVISSRIKTSRSHESLLSAYISNMQTIQLDQYKPDDSDSISVKKLHSSLLDYDYCFVISTIHGSKYYSCRNATERDQWIQYIQRLIWPNRENVTHKDESLNLSIQEMKKVSGKKCCFCEIFLDNTLYARTSASQKTETYFWGENFQFNNLNSIQEITINIYREGDKKKKKDKNALLGNVQINVEDLKGCGVLDRWLNVIPSSLSQTNNILTRQRSFENKLEFCPLIRVTAHYEEITVLPMSSYSKMITYIEENYMTVISTFESVICKVKDKELLASCLVYIMRKSNKSAEFLATIVTAEIRKSANAHLTLRGNSVASKAIEKFMNLVGERYIHETLSQFITSLIENNDLNCEVDPARLDNINNLVKNQENLKHYVDVALCKIFASYSYFPGELLNVFSTLKYHLEYDKKSDLVSTLLSSCVFLRFICPAILSPSMHGLAKKLPADKTRRNLTLVTKVIQNLANFTHFGTKEDYMIFFNTVVDSYMDSMAMFLKQISTNPKNNDSNHYANDSDIGKHLSLLHALLERLSNDNINKEENNSMSELYVILEEIRNEMDNGLLTSSTPPETPTIANSSDISTTSSNQSNNSSGSNSNNTNSLNGYVENNRQYPAVRSVYDNVDEYIEEENNKCDMNANSPICHTPPPSKELIPTPVLTSTSIDRSIDDVNHSWNAIVSAAQAINEDYLNKLPLTDEDSQMERASQLSAITSSGYQSVSSPNDCDIIQINGPTKHQKINVGESAALFPPISNSAYTNHYRMASKSSCSLNSSKTNKKTTDMPCIYHRQISTQSLSTTSMPSTPTQMEKTANEYENELSKLRSQLASAEARLASAEKLLFKNSPVKNTNKNTQIKDLKKKLSKVENYLNIDKQVINNDMIAKNCQYENQDQRLASLDAANARLLSALAHLRNQPSKDGLKLTLDFSSSSSC